jgi:hypothetical protein
LPDLSLEEKPALGFVAETSPPIFEFGRFSPEFINIFKPLSGRQGFELRTVVSP